MFKKILVPVDLSTENTSNKLCKTANDIAEKYGAKVILISVVPGYGMPLVASYFPEDAQQKLKDELRVQLDKMAETYFSKVKVKTLLVQGKRTQSILKLINETNPDLVMVGCRRKKSRNDERLLGSTANAVSDRAGCSVMVVR